MVRAKPDLDKRSDDSRFRKFDELISGERDRKASIILIVGTVILSIWLVASLFIGNASIIKPAPQKYDYGLNITYDPESSMYIVDYTNPNHTAQRLYTDIKIPLASDYISVFTNETSVFPANITYTPSDKMIMHTVSVMIVKPTGNYTYLFSNTPDEEEKMWNNIYKYINIKQ
jgi:hypothetical protein